MWAFALHAWAQPSGPGTTVEAEREADGVYLSANLDFSLPVLAEEAMQKGIAMTFVADAEVVRERWYWSDETVARAQRYLRVSYQPLTRRWRLSVSAAPFAASGLGISVGQTFDQLPDVLGAMQRMVRWKIADGEALQPHSGYRVNFQFQLDMSQLPRPLQIGALGRSGWNLSLARSTRVPPLAEP